MKLERFKERQAETVIDATIIVSQESQKGMVIGKGGAKIKEVGIKARNVREREIDADIIVLKSTYDWVGHYEHVGF